MKPRKWYEIRAAADGPAELWIYDDIGESLWGEGVAAKTFVPELNAITAAQIDLHINSYGGNVFDGMAIHNALRRHPANVTTYIDGVAASIASIVALAGDEIIMPSNAMLMIHNPVGSVYWGSEQEMRQMADSLHQIKEAMLNVYDENSTKGRAELAAAMDAETWLTAADAIEYGFAKGEAAPLQMAACAKPLDLGRFKHIPAALLAAQNQACPGSAEGPVSNDARRARALILRSRL